MSEKTPWRLHNKVIKNNTQNFKIFRCPDPVAVITEEPWYSYENICPCDPKLSNASGRGFTACPYGLDESTVPSWNLPSSQLPSQLPSKTAIVGNMFPQNQYVPPQMDPRPLSRIGQAWRSSN